MTAAVDQGSDKGKYTLNIMKPRTPIYGLIAEFDNPTDLVAAARSVHDYGYRNVDAYSPFPIHELDEAMGIHNRLPLLVLGGGIAGCIGGYLLQYWTAVIDYPIHYRRSSSA